MTTARREFLKSIGTAMAVPTPSASFDPRQIVSKLSEDGRRVKHAYDIPKTEDFWALEAVLEFENELNWSFDNDSSVPLLLRIAVLEDVPAIQLLAIASMRIAAHEVMSDTIRMLEYAGRDPGSVHSCEVRWAAAITLGLMGPAAIEALPVLRVRAQREEYVEPLAAVEWAIAEIGGAE